MQLCLARDEQGRMSIYNNKGLVKWDVDSKLLYEFLLSPEKYKKMCDRRPYKYHYLGMGGELWEIEKEILAYVNGKGDLVIKDIEGLARLIANPPTECKRLLSASEYAKKNGKSVELVKRYLRQERIIGAKKIKSEESQRGVWAIPMNAKWPDDNRKKKEVTQEKDREYHYKKSITKIPEGYITASDYANEVGRTVQQVINHCKAKKIEAKHILYNGAVRKGEWIIKKGSTWPIDGRKKITFNQE